VRAVLLFVGSYLVVWTLVGVAVYTAGIVLGSLVGLVVVLGLVLSLMGWAKPHRWFQLPGTPGHWP
jgi:hypothetical protein